MMLACSLLSYMDRQILAVLSPMILADLKLNAQKYSEIISAFSIAYMLGKRPIALGVALLLVAVLCVRLPTRGRLASWIDVQRDLLAQDRQLTV